MSSKKVDERVVEMRFDNQQFESGVKTTMSTLDKLKSALKFPSSSKSLDNLSKSVKNVNFDGMNKGIETVNAKFSAMQVVGMTALSNITSAAMQAGSNLVKSFTVDPITSGLGEFETQMNSIQTILANTKSKGTTLDDVTKALDELNTYADKTIYNFAEMTKNIGTFTAAGVDLNTSVGAIKGIANLGAMSSSTSAQVSTAMYQLSQALATGKVSLMDWNSVVNAGMGGEQFQQALERTAKHFGTDVDSMIAEAGSFRDSLTKYGWLTADVLTETLNQIGGAYDENALKAQGWSDTEIAAILELAKTAEKSATEIKTFSDMMGTLHEVVGSAWTNVWTAVFGDFDQAKSFFTDLEQYIEPMLTGPITNLGNVISEAMGMGGGSRWGEFETQLKNAGASMDDFQSKLSEIASTKGINLDDLIDQYGSLQKAVESGQVSSDLMSEALDNLASSASSTKASTEDLNGVLGKYQEVVDKVWRGDFKNAPERYQLLADAGWDYAKVQELVNKTVDGHKLTLEDLSSAQIVSLGYTQEQADALVEFAKQAKSAGSDVNQLMQDLTQPQLSGRDLFTEGIKNLVTAIAKPLQAIGDAFSEVFSLDASGLYDLIKSFNEFSKSIIISDDDAKNLKNTFKGIFSIVHILATGIGKTLTFAFKAVDAVLAPFGTNLLEVTGFIGDLIYQFGQWLTSGDAIEGAISAIGDACSAFAGPVSDFFNGFTQLPGISKIVGGIKSVFDAIIKYFKKFEGMSFDQIFSTIAADFQNLVNKIKDAYNKLKSLSWQDILKILADFGQGVRDKFDEIKKKFEEVGPDLIAGLQNGLKDGFDGVVQFFKDLGTKIVEAVCAVLGIHSPSTVFFEIGKNIIEGLCNGIKYLSGQVTDVLVAIVEDVKKVMSSIDWGPVIGIGLALGSFTILYKVSDALQGFASAAKNVTSPLASLGKVGDSVSGFLDALSGNQKGNKFVQTTNGIKNIAEAIAILAASIVVLTAIDQDKMWNAVGAVAALAGVLAGMVGVISLVSKFSGDLTSLGSLKLGGVFLSLGTSLILMSAAMKILSGIDPSGMDQAVEALTIFGLICTLLIGITQYAQDADKAAKVISKMGTALLLASIAMKILGGMDAGQMEQAQEAITVFGLICTLLIGATQYGSGMDKAAQFIEKVSIAFVTLAAAMKLLGGMDATELTNASTAITVLAGVMGGLVAFLEILDTVMGMMGGSGNSGIAEIGDSLLKISASIAILAVVAKLCSGIDPSEFDNGVQAIAKLELLVIGMAAAVKLIGGGEVAKIGTSLLAMSASIGILAGIAVLLSYVDPANLAKGIIAVGALAGIVTIMVAMTKNAKDVKGTMLGIAVAIGVMAAAIGILSFLDPVGLGVATACMSAVMAVFALVVKQASNVTGGMAVLIVLSAAIAIMAACLYALAGLPVENVAVSALALAALMGTLAGVLTILSNLKDISANSLISVGILTAVMAALGLILAMMSALGVESAIPNALALSTMLLAMSAAMVILSNVGSVSAGALGAMAILGLIMGELALVFAAMTALGVQDAMSNALALSSVLIVMSYVMTVLSLIGPLASGAISAAGAMAAVIAILAGVVVAAGAIKQIPGVDWLVSEGASFLQSLGEAIGGFIGGIVGGALEAATSSLPEVATNLSLFAVGITPFIMTMKMVDSSLTDSCVNLATAIAALTGAGFLDSIASLFNGGESPLTKLANELVPFGEGMAQFAGSLKGVDLAALMIGSQAAKALAEMANELPRDGGVFGFFTGESMDMGQFGNQLVAFGTGLKAYSIAVTDLNADAINASIEPAKSLNELAKEMPSSGGILDSIFGTQTDLAQFGSQLLAFGTGLVSYGIAVADLNTEAIANSIEPAKSLNELAKELPASGGILDSIFGSNTDLGNFGNQLISFGDGLKKYGDKVADLDTAAIGSSITATRDVINVLTAYKNFKDIGDAIGQVEQIKGVGTALKDYSNEISGVDAGQVSSSAQAITSLKDTISGLAGMDTSGVETFKSAIESLAQVDVQKIADAFKAVDMASIGVDLMNRLSSGMQSGSSAVLAAVRSICMNMLNAFQTSTRSIIQLATQMMAQFANGISSSRGRVISAINSALSGAASAARSYYSAMYSAGQHIGQGLANGMNSKISTVRAAGTALANAANTGTRVKAVISSPSKLFIKNGEYMGEGLVIGLNNYQRASEKAGSNLSEAALMGLNDSISSISEILDSNVELNPTITPVLDLSQVESGARNLNSMLNNVPFYNVVGSAGTINRMMNAMIQNGSENDVLKALDKLGETIADAPRDIYQVGDVMYDDGSNVAAAVNQLTRAIRLERRV